MTEYKVGRATVRIHGEAPSREKLEEATQRFLKKAVAQKKKKGSSPDNTYGVKNDGRS